MLSDEYGVVGVLEDYISCGVEYKRDGSGVGMIVCDGSDPIASYAINCMTTTLSVRVDGELRWRGRVDSCEYADVDGAQTFTLQLTTEMAHTS